MQMRLIVARGIDDSLYGESIDAAKNLASGGIAHDRRGTPWGAGTAPEGLD